MAQAQHNPGPTADFILCQHHPFHQKSTQKNRDKKTAKGWQLSLTIPICYCRTPRKKEKGEGEMSKDFVCGALTLLLAVWLIATLMFLQGEFAV
jgi:hypothetical protein